MIWMLYEMMLDFYDPLLFAAKIAVIAERIYDDWILRYTLPLDTKGG